MNGHQDRTARIRQMREAGDSVEEIASTLDISMELVQRIARKFETEEVLSSRSQRFLANVRNANDPDRKWKASYVIQALRLKTITQNALIRHFEWADTPRVSLRELMDLAIPEKDHPKQGYLITRLLDMRCIRVEGFLSVVSRLTNSDLGEKCNEEWRKRLARLRRCSRVVGAQQTWSQPFDAPSWLAQPEPSKTDPRKEASPPRNGTDSRWKHS